MSDEFKHKLLDGYQQDPDYTHIMDILNANNKINDPLQVDQCQLIESNKATLPFTQDEKGLIWHNGSGIPHLCIPQQLASEVLRITHTEAGHPGFARTFERAAGSWYIPRLGRHVRDFLCHCPECLVYQTQCHSPYGSLQPIQSLSVPFHTITLDFVLALPKSLERIE